MYTTALKMIRLIRNNASFPWWLVSIKIKTKDPMWARMPNYTGEEKKGVSREILLIYGGFKMRVREVLENSTFPNLTNGGNKFTLSDEF